MNRRYRRWSEVLLIPHFDLASHNINAYVYFALLSTLADRGWRLDPDPDRWRAGHFIMDSRVRKRPRPKDI